MRLRRRRPAEAQATDPSVPKTYLYVSDAKVAMLAEGIGHTLREQFDLKLDVGLPGVASVEVGSRQVAVGRYERAERLCKALDAQGRVGDVYQDESEFFRGTMLAVWGFWSRDLEGYADVVFFTALPDDRTLVGLGGSAYHTTERSEQRLQRWSNSGIQTLMDFIKERSEPTGKHHLHLPGAWYFEMGDADHDNDAVPEEIEFVAQRLRVHNVEGHRWILGSPIYVARTGRPTTNRMLAQYGGIRDLYSMAHYKRHRKSALYGTRYVGRAYETELPPLADPDQERGF